MKARRVVRPAGLALARARRSRVRLDPEDWWEQQRDEVAWCAQQDSNLQPLAPEANALSN